LSCTDIAMKQQVTKGICEPQMELYEGVPPQSPIHRWASLACRAAVLDWKELH
jgi:hypothetical protein